MSLPRPVSPSSSKRRNSSRGKLFPPVPVTPTPTLKSGDHLLPPPSRFGFPSKKIHGKGIRTPPRTLLLVGIALATCVLITLRAKQSTPSSSTSQAPTAPIPSTSTQAPSLASGAVNFDFDVAASHSEEAAEPAEDEEEDLETEVEEEGGDDPVEASTDDSSGGGEEPPLPKIRVLHPSIPHLPSRIPTPPHPYLPFTCSPCSSLSLSSFSSNHPLPTCAKYSGKNPSNSTTYYPSILDKSILFEGTGWEIKRVLRRITKSHLFSLKRLREGTQGSSKKFDDEEPFRVLVLGGSVSNCRGVDPSTACWHARVLKWFHKTIPLESDPHYLPPNSSPDVATSATGPLRLDTTVPKLQHRDFIPLPPSSDPSDASESPSEEEDPTLHSHSKRAVSHGKKKKSSSHGGKSASKNTRKKPVTRLINLAKSATGSAFFAYCFDAEVKNRKKEKELGPKGPDLIILEFGVNDVWPTNENATRDFEKLLRRLKELPSKPAIIILEAASLLLAETTSTFQNSEYLHLPGAQFFDVPILSVKNSLFGSQHALKPNSRIQMKDLFLEDKHHPNEVGHELLSDVLIHYLERQLCEIQSEVLLGAGERVEREKSFELVLEPELDLGRRREEEVLELPNRSLFDPFGQKGVGKFALHVSECLQVGNSKAKVEPKSNVGWSRLAWARDKQYLAATKPGSIVTFDVNVGEGGEILVDWLRSRFYDLGNVLVYLDNDKTTGVTIAGFWDLGWSIGVPTKLFENVSRGRHTVSFEVLPSTRSDHPHRKTSFRLIGLIVT